MAAVANSAAANAILAHPTGLVSGITTLGLVSDETEAKLTKVAAGFQIIAGTVNTIKSLQLIMNLLNVATLKNALLNTYNAVVQNPAALALVGAGAGAAISAAVILGGSSSSSSSSTTNNVSVSSSSSGTNTTVNNVITLLGGV